MNIGAKEYMKLTNNHNLPKGIYNAIANDTYDGPAHNSDVLSCTTINNPVRIHYLKKRHWSELVEDAADRLFSLMGQAVHAVLERAESKANITEERLERVIDGVTISGKMDVLEEVAIEDYKFTSVWQYVHYKDGKDEHIAQLNILNWLVNPIFPNITRLADNLILRDWSAGKAKSSPDFPRIPFVSIDVPIWPMEKTEAYLKERIAMFKAAADLPDDQLPECTALEVWERPTVYAIVKDGGKRAIPGGLCATMVEAESKKGPKMHIETRVGGRIRCAEYCVVSHLCNTYQAYLKINGSPVESEVV